MPPPQTPPGDPGDPGELPAAGRLAFTATGDSPAPRSPASREVEVTVSTHEGGHENQLMPRHLRGQRGAPGGGAGSSHLQERGTIGRGAGPGPLLPDASSHDEEGAPRCLGQGGSIQLLIVDQVMIPGS